MIFIAILIAVLMALVIVGHDYVKNCKPLKRFYCKIGWHCRNEDFKYEYDKSGKRYHRVCTWCGCSHIDED